MSDVAVVHDNFWSRGGSERVAEHIAESLLCPLYYGFGNQEYMNNDNIDYRCFLSDTKTKKLVGRSPILRQLYQIFPYGSIQQLKDFDVLVQTQNTLGWYIPKDNQTIIRYIHSTPRNTYDLYARSDPSLPRDIYSFLQRWMYTHTTRYPDLYIANSELVRRRLQLYWDISDRKIEVVYPPVDVESFYHTNQQQYYFTISRLEANKNVGDIVEAFNNLGYKLKIAGHGSELKTLREKADDNIEFLGRVSEEKKQDLYSRCKALVFSAKNEDFGIVPIEGFASGKPCIGVKDGYTRYQIVEPYNGYLYSRNDIEGLKEKIELFEDRGVKSDPQEIQGFAERFSLERFRNEIKSAVEKARDRSRIDVDFGDRFKRKEEVLER